MVGGNTRWRTKAKQMGFEVTDQDLANANPFHSTIQALSLRSSIGTRLSNKLGNPSLSLRNDFRKGLALNALESLAIEGSIVSPADVEAEYRKRNEKIKLDYLAFDPTKIAAELKPTSEQVKAYFDRNKNFFLQPETRDVQLIVADQAQWAKPSRLPTRRAESYYNSHKDQYRTPERVQARHILIKTTGKSKEETAQLQAKAEDLFEANQRWRGFRQAGGEEFGRSGLAAKGGDLGWVVRGQMVKNFEDTVSH